MGTLLRWIHKRESEEKYTKVNSLQNMSFLLLFIYGFVMSFTYFKFWIQDYLWIKIFLIILIALSYMVTSRSWFYQSNLLSTLLELIFSKRYKVYFTTWSRVPNQIGCKHTLIIFVFLIRLFVQIKYYPPSIQRSTDIVIHNNSNRNWIIKEDCHQRWEYINCDWFY